VEHRLGLRGYVPFEPDLLAVYRRANRSSTCPSSRVPQDLIEAMAAGLPIVATDLWRCGERTRRRPGWVARPACRPRCAGRCSVAVSGAVLPCRRALRNRIVSEGLRVARTLTLESEAGRVPGFIDVQARVSPPHEL
jgi:Glycosyl transferases group 1